MTKSDLIEQLQQALLNFQFGMTLFCHFPPEVWPRLKDAAIDFEGVGVNIHMKLWDVVERHNDPQERVQLHDQYERCLCRALLGESYELLVGYCKKTNQLEKFQSKTWYQFARLIRNTVSHGNGGILTWPKPDKKTPKQKHLTSASWRHRTLLPQQEGRELQFSSAEALALFEDIRQFASGEIN